MSFELSGLVIVKNEAVDLPTAIESWAPVCDRLIVVDDESCDNSTEIARYYGAKVIDTCMDEDSGFAGLRNTGLEAVETSHVLVFDADERPTTKILSSIGAALKSESNTTAYRFRRRDNAFEGWLDYGRFGSDWQIRMFPSTVRYEGVVHELPILGPEYEFKDLDGIVEHYTYKSLAEYMNKMRQYSEKLAPGHTPPRMLDIAKIIPRNLIRNDGYKDGWRGLLMAVGDGWHEYMLRQHAQLFARVAQRPIPDIAEFAH